MSTMRVEFINPFVGAALNVFKTMIATELQRGQIYLHRREQAHSGLSGVIGLSGRAIGTVAIVVDNPTAIAITSRFLQMEIDGVNEDVVDCMGEVVNMVAGNAKAQLEEYDLSISLPSIIRGEDHLIEFPSDVTPICVPFTGEVGNVLLQVGFVVKD
ncbi:hypothetical protein Pan216_14170 [Planctomycetes bacterium Pan216]|uniref:Chemotaxis phosphatase CheX-like domain-containing protein n=1 Tax=Kolteria novifilia TaxID=2527975 RepID=A0A518B0R7_9BACT|nr:hypothetical protein Pan216_14170 [Planctomycetes bacterium Pan216]